MSRRKSALQQVVQYFVSVNIVEARQALDIVQGILAGRLAGPDRAYGREKQQLQDLGKAASKILRRAVKAETTPAPTEVA